MTFVTFDRRANYKLLLTAWADCKSTKNRKDGEIVLSPLDIRKGTKTLLIGLYGTSQYVFLPNGEEERKS